MSSCRVPCQVMERIKKNKNSLKELAAIISLPHGPSHDGVHVPLGDVIRSRHRLQGAVQQWRKVGRASVSESASPFPTTTPSGPLVQQKPPHETTSMPRRATMASEGVQMDDRGQSPSPWDVIVAPQPPVPITPVTRRPSWLAENQQARTSLSGVGVVGATPYGSSTRPAGISPMDWAVRPSIRSTSTAKPSGFSPADDHWTRTMPDLRVAIRRGSAPHLGPRPPPPPKDALLPPIRRTSAIVTAPSLGTDAPQFT